MSTVTTDRSQLTGTYVLDPTHTRLGFVARHAMVTKVRGSFKEFDGILRIDAANPSASHGKLVIQVDSLDTGNPDRDAHLRTNDFFALDRYPTIEFTSTKVEPVDDTTFRVTGDLTIRGVTRPVTIDFEHTGAVVDPWGNLRLGFEGRTTVSRKEWGLNWNVALDAGGVLVGDKVTLELDLAAVRQ